MTLPDFLDVAEGTDIILADATDYGAAAANNFGARTDQLDLTSLANDAARQSDKFDFGANWARRYLGIAVLEWSATPTAYSSVSFFLAPSNNPTAASGNVGKTTGSDSAWSGYTSGIAEALPQLQWIGALICSSDTGIQVAQMGIFVPQARYANLVVYNESNQALQADADEMSVALLAIRDTVVDS